MFNMFGGKPNPQQQPAPQQKQQQQPNPQGQQQPNPAPQNIDPNDPLRMQQNNPQNPNNPGNDIFATLWDNTPEDPNNPKPDNKIYGNVKLEQVMQSAGNLDFTSNIEPELLQAAVGGDMNSLIQIINKVGQQSYANALFGGMRVFDQGAEARFNSFNNELPGLINQHSAFSQTRELSPLATNPSTKPIYDMVAKQIIAKNPNATQAQINETVMQYIDMFKQVGGGQGQQQPTDPQQKGNEQWKDFFS